MRMMNNVVADGAHDSSADGSLSSSSTHNDSGFLFIRYSTHDLPRFTGTSSECSRQLKW